MNAKNKIQFKDNIIGIIAGLLCCIILGVPTYMVTVFITNNYRYTFDYLTNITSMIIFWIIPLFSVVFGLAIARKQRILLLISSSYIVMMLIFLIYHFTRIIQLIHQ